MLILRIGNSVFFLHFVRLLQDDEDNSLEPPLVIDESEDFDTGDRSNLKSVSDLLCQGCKKNKAFFMCAGCSRQWYCSKECQVNISN